MGVKPRENQPTTAPETTPVQMPPVILYSEPALMSWLRRRRMSISRRPELEKDNPVAPQIYVGPRRRRALASWPQACPHRASMEVEAALQALVDAAEAFAHSLPPSQETDRERVALMEAISRAQTFLPIEPGSRPGHDRRKSRDGLSITHTQRGQPPRGCPCCIAQSLDLRSVRYATC